MSKFLFVGDLHSNLEVADHVAQIASISKCDEIIQVGDWGFIWTEWDYAQNLSEVLEYWNIPMRFCDGNHENHPELRKAERGRENNILPFLTYQHRGSMKEFLDGTRMVFLGGAPSIDKKWRTPGINWWDDEYITQDDVHAALQHSGLHIDVLVTHDCAVKPEGFKDTDDVGFNYRADASHESIKTVIRGLHPSLHIHGHYHHRYEAWFEGTKVIGLGADVNDSLTDLCYIYERGQH